MTTLAIEIDTTLGTTRLRAAVAPPQEQAKGHRYVIFADDRYGARSCWHWPHKPSGADLAIARQFHLRQTAGQTGRN